MKTCIIEKCPCAAAGLLHRPDSQGTYTWRKLSCWDSLQTCTRLYKLKFAFDFWSHKNIISRKRGCKQTCLGTHVSKVMYAFESHREQWGCCAQPESSKASQAAGAAQLHCPPLPRTPVPHTYAATGHRQPLWQQRSWQPEGSEQEQLQPRVQHLRGTPSKEQWGTRPPSLCGDTAVPAWPWPPAHTAPTETGHSTPAVQLNQLPFFRHSRVLFYRVWPQKDIC